MDGLDERAAADLSGFLLDVKHRLLTVTRGQAEHDAEVRAEVREQCARIADAHADSLGHDGSYRDADIALGVGIAIREGEQ